MRRAVWSVLAAIALVAAGVFAIAYFTACTPAQQAEEKGIADAVLSGIGGGCARVHDGSPDGGVLVQICRVDSVAQVAIDPAFEVIAQATDGGIIAINPALITQTASSIEKTLLPPKDAGGQ